MSVQVHRLSSFRSSKFRFVNYLSVHLEKVIQISTTTKKSSFIETENDFQSRVHSLPVKKRRMLVK